MPREFVVPVRRVRHVKDDGKAAQAKTCSAGVSVLGGYFRVTTTANMDEHRCKTHGYVKIIVSTVSRITHMVAQTQVSIEEAQARLPEIIHRLAAGDEVEITEGRNTVARLLGASKPKQLPRTPGSAKGKLVIVVEDEEHLRDFGDYMP